MLIQRWDGDSLHDHLDELAEESPLEIRLRGRGVSVTMRTPGHDAELAAGFLLTEGIIRTSSDILHAEHCERNEHGNILNVLLAPDVHVDMDRLTRHVFASSSCGVCGKASIDSIHNHFPPIPPAPPFNASPIVSTDMLSTLPETMRTAQSTFERTGGLHAAAIFDLDGNLIVLREDVGRHNAVDKVIGHCLLNGPFPLDAHVLLVSGRTSFEIMQKSLAARIPIVAAISAPSSLAAQFAADSGQTLVGFLRGRRMNIYTHSHRIRFPDVADLVSRPRSAEPHEAPRAEDLTHKATRHDR